MSGHTKPLATSYLSNLPSQERDLLTRHNVRGLTKLTGYLASKDAVAFLGAGTSSPLYPLWGALIERLIAHCAGNLSDEQERTCRRLTSSDPAGVVNILRSSVGKGEFREILRQEFRARRDPQTGDTWTVTQASVARCNFAGIVTTNYDPGIINARMAVRQGAQATGFAAYNNEMLMDRWRTGEIFDDEDLPVLFAHGQHNQPDEIVLAADEYRRAYRGKLRGVLQSLFDRTHIVWIGFGFGDRRIQAILDEVDEQSGNDLGSGVSPRHIAVMPWDPADDANDPGVLRDLFATRVNADVIFYPAPSGDHSALQGLLDGLADPCFVETRTPTKAATPREDPFVVCWTHAGDGTAHFVGRSDEIIRLDRWAADPNVKVIALTGWGGAGKSALLTKWLNSEQGTTERPVLRGLFGWSFYEERSGESWAAGLLEWMQRSFGYDPGAGSLENRVLRSLREVPVVLALDGLEVIQEAPGAARFGRILDTTVRQVATGACRIEHEGLLVLASRSPFGDLEEYDGTVVRMLDMQPFSPAEGASLIKLTGGDWLPENERIEFVKAVDGHALAVTALAGAIAERPAENDLRQLRTELHELGRTDLRVARVLRYYYERSLPADRLLLAVVSMFQRPVASSAIITVSSVTPQQVQHRTPSEIEIAVRQRLTGLLSWHADGTVSAHPLVRDTFRPLALTPKSAQLASTIALADVPDTGVGSRDQAERVVEMVELLLEANDWSHAWELYEARAAYGHLWRRLPAAGLGERCARAFVGTPSRREECSKALSEQREDLLHNDMGLFAMLTGDAVAAEEIFRNRFEGARSRNDRRGLSSALRNHAAALELLGDAEGSRDSAQMALRVSSDHRLLRPASFAACAAAAELAGDSDGAEALYRAADEAARGLSFEPGRLCSAAGTAWARFLIKTGRVSAARELTESNLRRSEAQGRSEDVLRCGFVLGLCDLQDGRLDIAGERLRTSADALWNGELFTEWAMVLTSLAEQRRRVGEHRLAVEMCTRAIAFASPRRMIPTHAAALATRSRTRIDLSRSEEVEAELARDDAENSYRLATRVRRLPWMELESLGCLVDLEAANEPQVEDGNPQGPYPSVRLEPPRRWSREYRDLKERLMPSKVSSDSVVLDRLSSPYFH